MPNDAVSDMEDVHDRGVDEATRLNEAISAVPLAMVLTDPRRDDNPITYVNAAFERVTLYSRRFAVGRNCRFLQGEDTTERSIEEIREGLRDERDVSVDVVNYKADGTPFRNRLLISPIRNDEGELVAFLGVQRELPPGVDDAPIESRAAARRPPQDVMLAEVQHRVKNHLTMIVSMIRLQAEQRVTRESFEALSQRIESLALLYDELSESQLAAQRGETVAAGAYLSRLCATLNALDGRRSVRVNVDCEEAELPVDLTARLGLLTTEFVTNALEHAFEGRDQGAVRIRFYRRSDGGWRLTVEDDGIGLPAGSSWPWRGDALPDAAAAEAEVSREIAQGRRSGLGGLLITSLTRSLDGQLDVKTGRGGTTVCLDLFSD